MLKLIRFAVVFCALLFSQVIFAGIEVTPILIDVKSGDINKQDIRVYNRGDKTAYVKVTPNLVVKPGDDQEKFISPDDPTQLGLLVTPRLMVIPPGQFKLVRLVLTVPQTSQDRLYQIDIRPTVGDLMMPKNKNEVGVKVLVGYGVVVIQRPQNVNVQYRIARTDHTLTVENVGNTNFVLANGQQCNQNGKQCKALPAKRLYAGKTWSQTVPYNTKVSYELSYLQTMKKITST